MDDEDHPLQPANSDAKDPFELLPDEVMEFLLSLLSPYDDLRAASLVSRRFRRCSINVVAQAGRDFHRCVHEMSLVWKREDDSGRAANAIEISKRYSHSAAYDDDTMAMFVFGGCTSTSTTFNDLWRLDLNTRRWSRPMATGTYPSPKACAVMVLHKSARSLILFGGWTHPSLYPLHQSWRLFNELHQYDLAQSRWTHVMPNSSLKPPAMAGHSATIHGDTMVVFGGLHKQRSSIGQFSSSNDVWCFNLTTNCWQQKDIPEPRPTPRYGQSQLLLDDNHLIILGGCGGPNNIFTDVWLLIMTLPHWTWVRCEIANPEHGASHMWCHPAVKVNNFAVILGKNRSGTPRSKNLSDSETAQFNVIPQLSRGINRGYASIRRPSNHESEARSQRRFSDSSDASDMDTSPGGRGDDENDISVEPVTDGVFRDVSPQQQQPVFKSSVRLDINQSERPRPPQASPSMQRQASLSASGSGAGKPNYSRQLSFDGDNPVPSTSRQASSLPLNIRMNSTRMQAFATNVPNSSPFAPPPPSGSLGAVPKNPNKQLETRQKQLNSLKKMEEKLKALGKMDAPSSAPSVKKNEVAPQQNNSCMCHRLSMYVLDIGAAIDRHLVTWMDVKSNASLEAPEETILYTLIKGRGELVMFGGIQKDVSSMTSRAQPTNANDSVSSTVYYLNIPKSIV